MQFMLASSPILLVLCYADLQVELPAVVRHFLSSNESTVFTVMKLIDP
jgi:hypothetical protein